MYNKGSFLALIITASITTHLLGQAPIIQWHRTFGGVANDRGYSVQQTSDGGYVIAGNTNSLGAGNTDFYLVKTNSYGGFIWDATFGGEQADYCYSVKQTPDGGYILGGCTRSYGSGSSDFYLVKTDDSGNMEWHSTFGADDNEYCYSTAQTSDGGYVMCGSVSVNGCADIYIVKADSLGIEEWDTVFGGIEQDITRSVQQTTDGGYILAGETASQGAGGSDLYLAKLNASGVLQWDATFGSELWERSYSLEETSEGGYALTGNICTNGQYRTYLVKTDDSGTIEWDAILGTSSSWSIGRCVQQTSDGGFVVAGTISPVDFLLVKTDSNGNPEWETSFGGADYDYCYSVQQTSDGGYILGGSTESFGAGQEEIWLVKFAPPLEIAGDPFKDAYESLTITVTPNPFHDILYLDYILPITSTVEISVYNVLGRRIKRFADELQATGEHSLTWNGTSDHGEAVPNGIYFVRVTADDQQAVEKLVLIR